MAEVGEETVAGGERKARREHKAARGGGEGVKPIGEELDIIHTADGYHMRNIAYTDTGNSMFICDGCGIKVIVVRGPEGG